MITSVGLMTRPDCCQSREDTVRVILANTEAMPGSIVGATDCDNPGGGFGPSVYRNYSCSGSAPARFVYVALFCSSVRLGGYARIRVSHIVRLLFYPLPCQLPCAAISPAEITVWGYQQTYPPAMARISFLPSTSTMSSFNGACTNPQLCAANAINGIVSTTEYVHTSTTALVSDYSWGMWDTGSNLTSIDQVFFLTRNLMGSCQAVWRRDSNIEVAISNDTASLSNSLATPAALRCNSNLGGPTSGGNLNQGLVAPWNWSGGDCKRIGRYMYFRKLGLTTYKTCDGFTLSSTVSETINGA